MFWSSGSRIKCIMSGIELFWLIQKSYVLQIDHSKIYYASGNVKAWWFVAPYLFCKSYITWMKIRRKKKPAPINWYQENLNFYGRFGYDIRLCKILPSDFFCKPNFISKFILIRRVLLWEGMHIRDYLEIPTVDQFFKQTHIDVTKVEKMQPPLFRYRIYSFNMEYLQTETHFTFTFTLNGLLYIKYLDRVNVRCRQSTGTNRTCL